MSNLIKLSDYRRRSLAEIEAKWDQCMARAGEYTAAGHYGLARRMIEEAKSLRKEMLRAQKRK